MPGNRTHSKTSSFGVSKRESHDSSDFYKRRVYDGIEYSDPLDNIRQSTIPSFYLDTVICKSSESMAEIPDSSINLVVTSPPYNVGKKYDRDLTLDEYRELLKKVFLETFRVLVSGGRACINVANIGRKPYLPMHSYIMLDMLSIGFIMRGEIIWNKGASAGSSTAWGSWMSASNPSLRDTHEYILVFSKDSFSHAKKNRNGISKQDTITKEEFLSYTKSIWEFPAESATRVGHPAPFPIELPYRCIQLYSFKDDVVLDPFCGVGSTCLAAIKSRRHYIGYENNPVYVNIAKNRIAYCI
jgi:site-specific DNA-methyltransferase (adenine-specific)